MTCLGNLGGVEGGVSPVSPKGHEVCGDTERCQEEFLEAPKLAPLGESLGI